MNDDLFGHDYDEKPPGQDNLFLWTIGILLLIGLAMATWLGTYYVFGHPEKPDSYRILQKFHKLEPPKRFELTEAPAGEFLTPQKAYEKYSMLSPFQLARENEALLRDYINNFQSTKRLVPYLTGRYSIMNSYELKSSDFFGSGVVAVAQSVDFPQTVMEHVYTAEPKTVPVLEQMLATGLDIQLAKMNDLAAVIHIERMFDGRLQFTVVPLLYGSYALKQGRGNFNLEPPAILNPAGGLPVVRDQLLQDCLKTYADYQRARSGRPVAAGGTPVIPVARLAAATTIVRVESPETPTTGKPDSKSEPQSGAKLQTEPATTPAPPVAVAVATPATPSNLPAEPSSGDDEPGAAPAITPHPRPTASTATSTPPPAPATASATPAVAVATPAPGRSPILEPFLVSAPTPGITTHTREAWRTYSPGQMPRGRLVSLSEAGDLAERGTGGELLYLRGNFVVTALSGNRAVLRSSSTLGNVLGSVTKQPPTRVIVEFPSGTRPPSERSNVSRDEMRPFEVRDIQRTANGEINIYVREVTTPQ